ncbi:MAG: ribosomal protein uL23 [Candidatus Woesearchaeota archaeon]|jgi:ribosomal protein uL23
MTIIHYPLSNEKSIRMMESENKLIFVVDRKATKPQIKEAMKTLFDVKVTSVNTQIARDGTKRAVIQFSMDTPAIDVATNLGLI